MKTRIPQLLLIAGTGRNSGKTTLVCDVIRHVCRTEKVTAIKITPHFHEKTGAGKIIADEEGLFIVEEQHRGGGKDSSKMLDAGAEKVYFAMAAEEKILQAFRVILKLVPENQAMICESGGLGHYIDPGLFLMMNRSDRSEFKPDTMILKARADRWITFDGAKLDFDPQTIIYQSNKWTIAPTP